MFFNYLYSNNSNYYFYILLYVRIGLVEINHGRSVFKFYTMHAQKYLITVRNKVAARLCFYTCLSFCPLGGSVCLSACWDTHTPWADTPLADSPPGRHPPPPGRADSTAADGTHPTGMHSCLWFNFNFLTNLTGKIRKAKSIG